MTASPPLLSKVPLMSGVSGRAYLSNHKITRLRLSPVTGVLLHFKLFADFHNRVAAALQQGQHFDGGSEYGRYASALISDPALCFAHPGSVRYHSSRDLMSRGLLKSAPSYESFCARVVSEPPAPGGAYAFASPGVAG
jgi:hypothetical protein